ncbi:hypothetical protein Tco_0772741 [Tanacetum coccineum]|uniref:Uncharacterized protein n=1 Tax=Tanacetum coccineum TaxID=301880 RepID=A0ABQ4ZIW7_9ASTR
MKEVLCTFGLLLDEWRRLDVFGAWVAPYPLSPSLFLFPPPAVESEVHRLKLHYGVVIALDFVPRIWDGIAWKHYKAAGFVEFVDVVMKNWGIHFPPRVNGQKEKVFVITTLKNDLRKLKGKEIANNVAQMSNDATIAPGMYKLDPVILAPKVKNNREAYKYYLKHTMEQAAILREVVEQAKSRNPLDSASYSTCMYVKLIQVFLEYVRDTCLDIHKPSEKLVAVTDSQVLYT